MADAPVFSIIIPSWNNLAYLKLCVGSILKNSTYTHQLIVHINDGSDGSLEWVKQLSIDHTYSSENVGVCRAVNRAFESATADYIVFMNDDMYVCPEWDHHLLLEINQTGSELFMFSSTMIEHTDTGNPCVIIADYGRNADDFNENKLLEEYAGLTKDDWQGSTWPPLVVHRNTWIKVGGFSEEFSPGMYSDPDFSMKLWQAGCRRFQGIGKSKVYHFQAKSTQKIQKNDGRRQFLRKWGLKASTFQKYYLKRGQPYTGKLGEPRATLPYRFELFKAKLERLLR